MKGYKDLKLVFTSTTGRSGTGYFANLINQNAENATAEHDPIPVGYGDPILWADNDEIDKLTELCKKKLKRLDRGIKYGKILNLPVMNKISGRKETNFRVFRRLKRELIKKVPEVNIKDIYVESTHSFNKSFGESMINLFPDLYLVHLVRNPLEVAKSFFNRRGPENERDIYLLEPSYKKNILKVDKKLFGIQKYLWYWIEIELRHKELINNIDSNKIIDFDVQDFSEINKIQELFKFLGIKTNEIEINVDRNKNTKQTTLDESDMKQIKEFLEMVPSWVYNEISYKNVFMEILEK